MRKSFEASGGSDDAGNLEKINKEISALQGDIDFAKNDGEKARLGGILKAKRERADFLAKEALASNIDLTESVAKKEKKEIIWGKPKNKRGKTEIDKGGITPPIISEQEKDDNIDKLDFLELRNKSEWLKYEIDNLAGEIRDNPNSKEIEEKKANLAGYKNREKEIKKRLLEIEPKIINDSDSVSDVISDADKIASVREKLPEIYQGDKSDNPQLNSNPLNLNSMEKNRGEFEDSLKDIPNAEALARSYGAKEEEEKKNIQIEKDSKPWDDAMAERNKEKMEGKDKKEIQEKGIDYARNIGVEDFEPRIKADIEAEKAVEKARKEQEEKKAREREREKQEEMRIREEKAEKLHLSSRDIRPRDPETGKPIEEKIERERLIKEEADRIDKEKPNVDKPNSPEAPKPLKENAELKTEQLNNAEALVKKNKVIDSLDKQGIEITEKATKKLEGKDLSFWEKINKSPKAKAAFACMLVGGGYTVGAFALGAGGVAAAPLYFLGKGLLVKAGVISSSAFLPYMGGLSTMTLSTAYGAVGGWLAEKLARVDNNDDGKKFVKEYVKTEEAIKNGQPVDIMGDRIELTGNQSNNPVSTSNPNKASKPIMGPNLESMRNNPSAEQKIKPAEFNNIDKNNNSVKNWLDKKGNIDIGAVVKFAQEDDQGFIKEIKNNPDLLAKTIGAFKAKKSFITLFSKDKRDINGVYDWLKTLDKKIKNQEKELSSQIKPIARPAEFGVDSRVKINPTTIESVEVGETKKPAEELTEAKIVKLQEAAKKEFQELYEIAVKGEINTEVAEKIKDFYDGFAKFKKYLVEQKSVEFANEKIKDLEDWIDDPQRHKSAIVEAMKKYNTEQGGNAENGGDKEEKKETPQGLEEKIKEGLRQMKKNNEPQFNAIQDLLKNPNIDIEKTVFENRTNVPFFAEVFTADIFRSMTDNEDKKKFDSMKTKDLIEIYKEVKKQKYPSIK